MRTFVSITYGGTDNIISISYDVTNSFKPCWKELKIFGRMSTVLRTNRIMLSLCTKSNTRKYQELKKIWKGRKIDKNIQNQKSNRTTRRSVADVVWFKTRLGFRFGYKKLRHEWEKAGYWEAIVFYHFRLRSHLHSLNCNKMRKCQVIKIS